VSGQDSKTLVCKIGGSTGTGSIVVGDIGTLIVDGSVTWQVASRVPFAVQAVPTEINGQPVPAGVYIDAAYVLNATIQNAQIANEAVDDSKIASLDVGKLTAGSLQTDSYVQSSNYVEGEQGFRINANGSAEFQNAVVRGAVFAESGTFAGSLSAATGTFSGALEAATGTFSGALSAATGSFSGSLSAATGTFSGSLTADAIDAVNTVNIAEQAVTFPETAYDPADKTITTSWTTLLTFTVNNTGAPVYLIGGCNFAYGFGTFLIGVFVDGTQVIEASQQEGGSCTVSRGISLIAGSHTITLRARNVSGRSTGFADNHNLLYLETKR
jgi:hypothetical protein